MMNEIEELKEVLESMNASGLLETMAKSYSIIYKALLKEGFNQEQVMAIITTQGLGLKET